MAVIASAIIASGCESTPLAAQLNDVQRNNLDKIYDYDIKPHFISFVVKSHGCTSKQDFELLKQQRDGQYEFALVRHKADFCRAMPRAYSVTFALEETVSPEHNINVLNQRYATKLKKMP